MNLFKDLQHAASRGARDMEVPLLLSKDVRSKASIVTRIITMVSVKESVFCFWILYHAGPSAVCDVIMITDTSS